jgi:hypothetical protein
VAGPLTWISDTFSSDAKEEDLVTARSLNITRIVGVVTPVLAGIWTAISELADAPPFNQADFQEQLILALIGLIALVSTADIFARAIATKTGLSIPVATPLPEPLKASKNVPTGPDLAGQVVAFRASNASAPAKSGEYLFTASDGATSWEPATVITLSSPE